MRASLVASLAHDPAFQGYRAGSIVICSSCWKPIYRLERGIAPGDRAGRAASAFAPLTIEQCRELLTRRDLHVVWLAKFAEYLHTPAHTALLSAPRLRAGAEAVCPCCAAPFAKVRAVELADVHDRAYVLELTVIEPLPDGRNRWIGERPRWIDPEVELDAFEEHVTVGG